jgi:succinate-acetate transporter protein
MECVASDSPARIYLQPIAAPSILGLYGFAGATFMVAANMAHWYGDAHSPIYLAPFAMMFGGLAQFLAGMWAFRARDGVATAMHGMWGAFWIAYGILQLMFVSGRVAEPHGQFVELGYWFVILAAITWSGAYAAAAENKGLVAVLTFLAAGSTTAAIGELAGTEWLMILSGYLFMISAVCAWYAATALMVNEAQGREVLKVGKSRHMQSMPPIAIGVGEPGVIRGQ